MRIYFLLIFLFCNFCSGVLLFGANPRVASIIVSETEVRGGPDWSFYPTSILQHGDKVEIYISQGDWYAIRPPEGSFSWVSAKYVSIGAGNVGVVLAAGLASRIGSDMIDQCDTVQVKLKRGEQIFILGKKATPENVTSPIWLKISPPNGEYRWIPRSAVEPEFQDGSGQKIKLQTNVRTAEYSAQPSNVQNYRLVTHTEHSETQKKNNNSDSGESLPLLSSPDGIYDDIVVMPPLNVNTNSILPASHSAAPNNSQPNSATKNKHNEKSTNAATPELKFDSQKLAANTVRTAYVQDRSNKTNLADGSDLNFQRVFEELQAETVSVLTVPTEDWVFETLINEASRLYDSAKTDVEMEKAYHLIESLKRGRSVRQDITARRQANVAGNYSNAYGQPIITNYDAGRSINSTNYNPVKLPTTSTSTTPNPNPQPIIAAAGTTQNPKKNVTISDTISNQPVAKNVGVTAVNSSGNLTNQFDVSGRLGMFDPLPAKHPPFAVVDKNGRITCLITPEAGFDLVPYIGQSVGINGIRGIYRKSGQPDSQHIIVKTIVIL
ncbi:MAG: SH3 domain-containing protein [Planctomycetaceae bacterium]|nr:SH3 domain-containing protein [Planctomycetaceae bacterium]